MDSQAGQLNSYPVEVSGWDASDNFFVEKTLFSWVADEKEVALRCVLRPGCVVFVRLLQPLNGDNNFPIPYQVKQTVPHDAEGKARVYLMRLRPRPGRNEEHEQFTDIVHRG